MDVSKRRRQLLQRILTGCVVAAGAVPQAAGDPVDPFAIREPVLVQQEAQAAPAGAIREPQRVAAFRPVREPADRDRPAPSRASTPAPPVRLPSLAQQTRADAAPADAARADAAREDAAVSQRSPNESDDSQRSRIARQVSRQILTQHRDASAPPPVPQVATLTSRRLAQQAADRLAEARAQTRRGTWLSARQSARQALALIADANDLLDGSVRSATALVQAEQALREAEHFTGKYGPVGPEAIARLVASHQTPVLQHCDTQGLNGGRAIDLYLDFARSKFAEVADANPIAIEALMVLAETRRAGADGDAGEAGTNEGPVNDAVVISLLRAALQAAPDDPVVANELGYQLLRQGLLEEAQWSLTHSYRLRPSRVAAMNLAETLRQRGDVAAARQVVAAMATLPQDRPAAPQLLALSPQQFAAMSPPTSLPSRPAIGPAPPSLSAPASQAAPQLQAGSQVQATARPLPQATAGPAAEPTPVQPARPAESESVVGRVASALSELWK
ncbi:tetratricopeptide repeat protein [Roseimaritima sediminicola]|uniref:hypothetical protein n=1 Tax=Roseimaritima sediminicola TaxID=2662066 RepID=UPI0012985503|nr:hypothetical protein [Roseimaritima sediminicola]